MRTGTNAVDPETDEADLEIVAIVLAIESQENLRAVEIEAVHEKHRHVATAREAVTGNHQSGAIVQFLGIAIESRLLDAIVQSPETAIESRLLVAIVQALEIATKGRLLDETGLEAATENHQSGSHQLVETTADLGSHQCVENDQAREAETSAHLHVATVPLHATATEDHDQYPRKILSQACRSCNQSF